MEYISPILREDDRILSLRRKKNVIAKDLLTPKYKTRVIKPKKGKGSFKRKKK